MAKSATITELEALHRLIARSLTERIQQDMEDKLPTDAATLGAAIKFLKDNNVSADPADADDLSALRDKLRAQADERREKRGLDGTPATLNAALIDQIDDAITVAVQAQWDRYWQRVDAVQAATTVEQIDAIVW